MKSPDLRAIGVVDPPGKSIYQHGSGLSSSSPGEYDREYNFFGSDHNSRDSSVNSSNNSCYEEFGPFSKEQRAERVKKYWEKKKRRKSQKFVRYECRKNLAEKRFRF